jgi:hypothetical protein
MAQDHLKESERSNYATPGTFTVYFKKKCDKSSTQHKSFKTSWAATHHHPGSLFIGSRDSENALLHR